MKKTTLAWISSAASLAVAAVWLLAPPPAEAASWRTCNGSPVIWRGTVNVHRNRCSIPDTGIVNSAYWNGVNQWDDLSNVVDGFYVNDASDCSISHGDGENEVGLVNRSVIDGNNGLTILQLGLCFIGSNDIDEADVMIANDLDFNVKAGNFRGTAGRSTFVHEFGHFFGFQHEDAHTVMRTSPPHLLTGGSEPSTVWPSDTIGMNSLYGFVSGINLLPSALGVVSGSVQTLDPATTVTMCRGGSRTTRFYVANNGNVSSGTYGLRIRLSTTAPLSGGYTQTTNAAAWYTHSLGAFTQGTYDLSFTVPSSLPNGTYYIYLDMDYAKTITERKEGDNSTVSAMKIYVNC